MLTLSQNGGNHVSEDLKFKNFPGEDAPSDPPTAVPPSPAPFLQTPSPKILESAPESTSRSNPFSKSSSQKL